VLLLKELGVAFLVAGIIGWAIEKQARERDNQRALQLRQQVANDAIFAIYGLRHRQDFIKAVVETNLEAKIVRENMVLKYTLRTLTHEEAAEILPSRPEDALQRFVVLEMFSSYDFKNVAAATEELRIRYAIALRQGAGARRITRAHYVCIGDKELAPGEIEAGKKSHSGADELQYEWRRSLERDKSQRVIISARCVKERSDNEVWGSFFPTMGDMSLTLSVLTGMRFGVRGLTNGEIGPEPSEPSDVSRSWRVSGPLLRHNSIVFWWRTPEDDAEEELFSEPVQFSDPGPAVALPVERRGLLRRLLDLRFTSG
jgi:hypothetical protein